VRGGRDPRNVGHLAQPSDRSSGTLGTVGGGGWGRFVADFMPIGCTFRRIDPRAGTEPFNMNGYQVTKLGNLNNPRPILCRVGH